MRSKSSTEFPLRSNGPHRFVDTDPSSQEIPVVLLHGMMGDVDNWLDTIRVLSTHGHRVVVPVMPIYRIALRQASLQGLVHHVVSFLDDVEITRAVVAGNSLGGHIAFLLASEHPDRVESLILTGASGLMEVDLGSSIMRRKDREYLRERVEMTFHNPVFCTEELLDEVIDIINDRNKVARLIKLARSVQNGSVMEKLSGIACPTLLIWGANDRITPPEVAETFHQGIAGSEIRFIERCGHAPMIEQPEVFNRIMLEYLEKSRVATDSMAYKNS